MTAILVRIFAVQILRWFLFENKLLRPLWDKLDDIPVLGYFVNCAFCQGFWLTFFIFLPFLGLLDSVVWGLMSAWLALLLQMRLAQRKNEN